ncbi:SpoIIE family protein phosphatase [Streptomyces sp. NPDC002835]
MVEPAGLRNLLARVLRCRDPQALLEALTLADDSAGALPAGRTFLYVQDRTGLHRRPAPADGSGDADSDRALDATAREVLRTGRRTQPDGAGPRTHALPLSSDGQVRGVLVVSLEGGGADGVCHEHPEVLDLVAECCAHVLAAHSCDATLGEAAEAARAGVFAWDFMADNVYWDERTCAIYGVDPATFDGAGDTFFALLHPDDVPVLQAAIARVTEEAVSAPAHGAAEDAGRYHLGYRILHPDGSVHAVTEFGRVIMDDQGRPTRAVGLVMETGDGTDRSPRGSVSADSSRDSFLFTLTRALSQAVTVRDVTRVMTQLARPALGAENLLLGIEEAGRLTIVGETAIPTALSHLRGPAHTVMALAARQEQALFIEDLSRHTGPELAELAATGDVPPRSWVVLSLGSVDQVTGACLIAFARPRKFDAGERTFYTAVAVILTQSLERARLFDTEHQRATDLQEAMLPRHLPALDSLTVHSRYLPGTQGMHIGGDWYDILSLRDGTAALVIGDVQGHDAHASAVMGQLRVALRACAEAGLPPGALLGQVNRVLCDLDTDRFATCTYLVLDPQGGELKGGRAGHLHPLRIHRGAVSEVVLAGGPPLGVDPAAVFPTTTTGMAGDEALVLFTDGLVERRNADIDVCVREMIDDIHRWAAASEDGLDLGQLVDFLARRDAPERIDDVALLAVQRVSSTDM